MIYIKKPELVKLVSKRTQTDLRDLKVNSIALFSPLLANVLQSAVW